MATGLRLQRRLTAFLHAGAARPFVWGSCDCCTWTCDWVLEARGIDPDAGFRGHYATARGAQRHLAQGGGLPALAARCMGAAGLDATSEPVAGDVGVVRTPQGEALAIRTSIGWAVKGLKGVVVMPYPVILAWSI